MTSYGLDVSETSLSELYIYINAFHCMNYSKKIYSKILDRAGDIFEDMVMP